MPLDNLTELKRRVPGGKYTLARAIAERARQLQCGSATPLVEVRTPNPLSVAIDEIVQGKITFRFGDDARDVTVVEAGHGTGDEVDLTNDPLLAQAAAALGISLDDEVTGDPAAPASLDEAIETVPDEAPADEIQQ